ncbi:MAG: chlorite dismutase family protein [Elusimicrobia bacterium]|nr:chlorite dismutase family protein [Elusimicrobiota bacterium]
MTDGKAQFVQYLIWRLDPGFHALESNERIVAKQSFLGTWESFQSRALLVSYSLTGLRADCDILCLRVSDSLEVLQDMTSRVQSSGMGKFLVPAFTYLAIAGTRFEAAESPSAFAPGRGRYLFLSPCARTAEWRALTPPERERLARGIQDAASKRGLRLQPPLQGLDEADELVAAEGDKPEEFAPFAAELRALAGETLAPAGPTFIAVLKDIRDQVDSLG